jgi:hypothetical protein
MMLISEHLKPETAGAGITDPTSSLTKDKTE